MNRRFVPCFFVLSLIFSQTISAEQTTPGPLSPADSMKKMEMMTPKMMMRMGLSVSSSLV